MPFLLSLSRVYLFLWVSGHPHRLLLYFRPSPPHQTTPTPWGEIRDTRRVPFLGQSWEGRISPSMLYWIPCRRCVGIAILESAERVVAAPQIHHFCFPFELGIFVLQLPSVCNQWPFVPKWLPRMGSKRIRGFLHAVTLKIITLPPFLNNVLLQISSTEPGFYCECSAS